jgi:hypothetical protein
MTRIATFLCTLMSTPAYCLHPKAVSEEPLCPFTPLTRVWTWGFTRTRISKARLVQTGGKRDDCQQWAYGMPHANGHLTGHGCLLQARQLVDPGAQDFRQNLNLIIAIVRRAKRIA